MIGMGERCIGPDPRRAVPPGGPGAGVMGAVSFDGSGRIRSSHGVVIRVADAGVMGAFVARKSNEIILWTCVSPPCSCRPWCEGPSISVPSPLRPVVLRSLPPYRRDVCVQILWLDTVFILHIVDS